MVQDFSICRRPKGFFPLKDTFSKQKCASACDTIASSSSEYTEVPCSHLECSHLAKLPQLYLINNLQPSTYLEAWLEMWPPCESPLVLLLVAVVTNSNSMFARLLACLPQFTASSKRAGNECFVYLSIARTQQTAWQPQSSCGRFNFF
jgi:hypothetical protein